MTAASGPSLHAEYASVAYTRCYCEENVYLLCQALLRHGNAGNLCVVFISNESQMVLHRALLRVVSEFYHQFGSDPGFIL